MIFLEKLESEIEKNNSLLSIGLEPDPDKIPKHLFSLEDPLFEFNKAIIDATHDLVCAYKPQIATYSALGVEGLKSLLKTVSYLKKHHPDIPLILDAKRGDIARTSEKYAKEAFDVIGADAVTVNPYLGLDALEPFLQRKEKGIIILCRTSNLSASDFQDLLIYPSSDPDLSGESRSNSSRQDRYQMVTRQARTISSYEPLYIKIAKKVVEWNEKYRNCLMVIGATWPEQLKEVRKIAPEMFFLVPGIGTQRGDLQKTLKYGLTKNGSGLIIHSSSAIIYASSEKNFAQKAKDEAKKVSDLINKYRYGR